MHPFRPRPRDPDRHQEILRLAAKIRALEPTYFEVVLLAHAMGAAQRVCRKCGEVDRGSRPRWSWLRGKLRFQCWRCKYKWYEAPIDDVETDA